MIQVAVRGALDQLQNLRHEELMPPARAFRTKLLAELQDSERRLEQSKAELQLASALNPCWRTLFFCQPDERAGISLRLKREALAAGGGLAAGQSADQVPAPQPAKAL